MYLSNVRGMWKIWRDKPQLGSIALLNLTHRATHHLKSRESKKWSHPPEIITVFVTDRCNLRCRSCHCAHSETPGFQLNHVGDMDAAVFRKLMDDVPGHPIVSFTGGEPLLHPEISDFIAYAKAKGRLCALVTNGWLLTKKAQELCESGLDILTVSLDGPELIHDTIRKEGSYERLVAGVKSLLERSNRPIVIITMAISDLNYDKLVQTYELAKSWGVDGMNINHLWMQTEGMVEDWNSNFSLFPGDQVAWQVKLEQIDADILGSELETIRRRNWGRGFLFSESPYLSHDEIYTWYQEPEQSVKYNTVRCGWARFKVWSDGKVKPCRDLDIGNINQQPAMEIWNGQEYQEFRQALTENRLLPICTRCCWIAYR